MARARPQSLPIRSECAYVCVLYAGGSYYDPLLARQMGGMHEYPLYDGTGTARGTVNQAGTPQYSWDLDAFGRYPGSYADSTWFPYRFGGAWGYETDPSGLLQLGARWYP